MELGTIIEHDFRVKVSEMTDVELHQEIVGQWQATRDFDEDQMNIMIQELARRAKVAGEVTECHHGVNDGACKECYLETEVPCKTDPRAPHGFDRNASHNADRYVCECEGWEPVDTVYMSEKHVHKTDKSIHEWVGLTHREMQELMSIRFIDDAVLATEAKLKEKNS